MVKRFRQSIGKGKVITRSTAELDDEVKEILKKKFPDGDLSKVKGGKSFFGADPPHLINGVPQKRLEAERRRQRRQK